MPRITVFHVFYSSTFMLLFLLLCGLLLITPGDLITQSLRRTKQQYNVFSIAAVYLVTALSALIVYISRIVSMRRAITALPRSIEDLHAIMPRRAKRAAEDNLRRSAWVTAKAYPPAQEGWIVKAREVVAEIPGVLEERVVGLVDEEVARRREQMSLRKWMEVLAQCEVVGWDEAVEFSEWWERVRFGGKGGCLKEEDFRGLMRAFRRVVESLELKKGEVGEVGDVGDEASVVESEGGNLRIRPRRTMSRESSSVEEGKPRRRTSFRRSDGTFG